MSLPRKIGGWVCVLLGIVCNPFVVARLAINGSIDSARVRWAILLLETILRETHATSRR